MTDAFPTTSYLAWQFSQIIAGRLERALREEHLTLAQHNALLHTVRTPGLSVADIARRSDITAQSMGAAVNQLVERGLLRREPHPASRRSMRLFATEDGRTTAARALAISQRIDSETTTALSRDEGSTMYQLLYRLVEDLNPASLAGSSRATEPGTSK
ncbi:MarR family winged helix-turn-helix transcriptional regulator [Streptomyces sp. NBC_00063]|uniref:MarR family winged helix-turn-helix transcriptional regulator n=1 Tax=Streptomyces sp. NBC_00063 TaxID=2975638 RepID=UPI003D70351E